MKRRSLLLTLFTVLVGGALLFPQQGQAQSASQKTAILLDGYPLNFGAEPIFNNGVTMVPFRGIAEALNIQVQWNAKQQTITANQTVSAGSKQVILQLQKKEALVDGRSEQLAAAPFAKNSTTYIPLSFFSKQFGAQVSWNQTTKVVSIESPQKSMYHMAFYAISSYSESAYIPQFDAVAFGWMRLQEDGTLTTSGKDFYWPQPAGDITPESIVENASAQGTSPYLMVFASDGKNELTKLLESEELRTKAIQDIMQLAQEKHFSGIMLDFEGLGLSGDIAKAQQDFNDFVELLSTEAKQANLKLSLALHPLNGAYQGYDYKTLASLADDLVIMAYAYENEDSPEPLLRVDEAIKAALKVVPKEQLVLGISFGSEDEQSVNSKIGLAKRYQLKGTAFWRLGLIGESAMNKIEASIQPLKMK